ncbi:MAG: glycogen debranching protein GlgX [Candidatus Ancillula sp.]|nr:glycogen debranching protein GlgX [Candidatus Ancillula sp.]
MKSHYSIKPGSPYPLGATYDGSGTNFALNSEVAQRVELCIFDKDMNEERIEITECDNYVWHIYIQELMEGTQYGYRVYGPDDVKNGNRCNGAKLLLDPYAKAFTGKVDSDESIFSYYFSDSKHSKINSLDSALHVMKSVVVSQFFNWGNDRPPEHSYADTVIYEVHVKAMTILNKSVPEKYRGTYTGLAHPSTIAHLKKLGITAIELMPVHQSADDGSLEKKGLSNFWGYNTIGFFAPENKYAAYGDLGFQVNEFKHMVKVMHENNIEVILDVVYNHTAEGNHLGPTLSFKGIDNKAYYRLVDGNEEYYFDTTGTGNSLLMRSPQTLQLIMDSLRYWVNEMHVDGFRFDLAATLARQFHEVDKLSVFFDIIHQDPVLSRVKLIAEPWDLGDGGYQVGGFPVLWSEWNGRYRDTIRDFWRGEDATLASFATRITGSSDLYAHTGRRPVASINFFAAHDGFTLNDLVSYNEKHNEANGEDSKDGESHNRSFNCGAEGETSDAAVISLRNRQRKNFLTTLFLSQGVPMILYGDEMGRTQSGNNNAYCQDNEIAWMNWDLELWQNELLEFTAALINYRKIHPVLRRRNFFSVDGDAIWFDNEGAIMKQKDWNTSFAKTVMLFIDGSKITERDQNGDEIIDDSFLIIFNGHYEEMEFELPKLSGVSRWELVLDTALTTAFVLENEQYINLPGSGILVSSRSVRLYKAVK